MLNVPVITRSRWHYYLILAALAALPVLATLALSRQSFSDIALQDYLSYRCDIPDSGAEGPFRVLTLTSSYAIALADRLCSSASIKARYSRVEISWHPRSYLQPQDILENRFELIWNRRHVVEGLVPEVYQYYQPIMDSPRYTLFWASQQSRVEMSNAYFADKVVGLSQDQQSQTYYLQPMNALKRAAIALDSQQIRYFSSIAALYDAFEQGRVDIISSTRNPALIPDQRSVVFTPLADDVPSGTWLLRQSLIDSPAGCDIVTALTVFDPLFDRPPTILLPGGCP